MNRIAWICFSILLMSCEEAMMDTECDNEATDGGCSAYDSDLNEIGRSVSAVTGNLTLNDVYRVTGDTPLYSTAAGTTVLRTIADKANVKIVVSAPSNGRYRVEHASAVWGWIAGSTLSLSYHFNSSLSSQRTSALARARVAMGFSYWYGHGRWDGSPTGGATPSNRGVCSGNCPPDGVCTHTPNGPVEYGSDCIHFVDTIWGAGMDTDPATDGNGCSISQFRTGAACVGGTIVSSMANVRAADAVATTGHIFLVDENYSAVGGSVSIFECLGCSYKCRRSTKDLNTLANAVAVTKTGW